MLHIRPRTTHSRRVRPPRGGNDRGFTLVEMMIALVLFGLGLMALAQSLPSGLAVRDKARRMSVATSLAQESVEQLRTRNWDDAALAAGTHTDPDNPINGAYVRRWEVQDGFPVPDMKRITVTVSFPTASADSVSTMTTQITRGSN